MLQASVVSVDDSDSCLGHVEYLKAGEALLEMPKNPPPPIGLEPANGRPSDSFSVHSWNHQPVVGPRRNTTS